MSHGVWMFNKNAVGALLRCISYRALHYGRSFATFRPQAKKNPSGYVRWLSVTGTGLLLAACGFNTGTSSSSSDKQAAAASASMLMGVLHGGQAPIVGSTVTIYSAGQPASAAAITIGKTTTDATGTFSFVGFKCPSPTALIYVVASGGDAGAGANPAIQLMAALGPCSAAPNSIVVNELTTFAAVYALNGFSNLPPPSVTGGNGGLGGCIDCTPVTPITADMSQLHGDAPAFANAFATAALLANVETGLTSTFLPNNTSCIPGLANSPVNCSAEQRLTALSNSLAACVNSSTNSQQCSKLFACAVPGSVSSSSGTCVTPNSAAEPINTLQAALFIARYPGIVGIAGIFQVASPQAPFSPGLATVPTDWTVALNFTGGGITAPQNLAIDAAGNIWTTNAGNGSDAFSGGTVSELAGGTGIPISPANGFIAQGIGNNPIGLAIDMQGNVWITSHSNGAYINRLVKVNAVSGNPPTSAVYPTPILFGPYGVAIDPSDNVWVSTQLYNNQFATSMGIIFEFDTNGGILPPRGLNGGGLSFPEDLAIDGGSNTWVANRGNNSVTKFGPSGAPLSPATGFSTADSVRQPDRLAIDPRGNVWVTSRYSLGLAELSGTTGSLLSPSGGFSGGGMSQGRGITVDSSGNILIANTNSTVSEFSPDAVTPLSPSTGFTGGGIANPVAIAVDGAGNVWVANNGSSSVTAYVGLATPTRTPLVANITKPAAALASIAVTPANASVANGASQQFTATGTYVGSSVPVNITHMVSWQSSNSNVATISGAGLATCVTAGQVDITASFSQSGITVSGAALHGLTCQLPLALTSIAVMPATASINVGATALLSAIGAYTDGSTQDLTRSAIWTSSAASVATVNSGLATGVGAGVVTISAAATAAGQTTPVKGTAQVTVKPSNGIVCNTAPTPSGGGTQPFANQSYCATYAGTTDQLFTFTGILTFTTPLTIPAGGTASIAACSYDGVSSTQATGRLTCVGTVSSSGALSITGENTFAGTFAADGTGLTGTYNFGNFNGGVAVGSFTGAVVH